MSVFVGGENPPSCPGRWLGGIAENIEYENTMTESESSLVEWIDHDPNELVLSVKLRTSSKVYKYSGVTDEAHLDFINAESHGQHFNKFIRGTYEEL